MKCGTKEKERLWTIVQTEEDARPTVEDARPKVEDARPNRGGRSSNSGGRSSNSEGRSSKQRRTLVQQWRTLVQQWRTLVQQWRTLVQKEEDARPTVEDARPTVEDARPTEEDARPTMLGRSSTSARPQFKVDVYLEFLESEATRVIISDVIHMIESGGKSSKEEFLTNGYQVFGGIGDLLPVGGFKVGAAEGGSLVAVDVDEDGGFLRGKEGWELRSGIMVSLAVMALTVLELHDNGIDQWSRELGRCSGVSSNQGRRNKMKMEETYGVLCFGEDKDEWV
ncbi:hypothetical protein LR48_Vigan317s001500 [Vigna angularis]|uniref:Uncharacterized protein n=1 Tax=Phaseolus angularis TaxID=3914 RepID=A0A0L9T9M1_PHAAN|nr:hypothetical protein LR48_Vigan317s001500 [Vigna angularis]